MLNAAPGLGDALVGGRVQPEEIEIAFDDLGTRSIVRRDGPTGVLTDEQALRLGRLVLRVHWALGDGQDPQDVEWAYDGERFWLVQARPVTRVPRLTFDAVRDLPVIWSNANLKDAVAGVPTTFGWSVTQEVLRAILYAAVDALGYRVPSGMEIIRRLDGRAYFDLTTMEWVYYDALGLMPAELNAGLGGMQPELPMPSDRPLEGPDGRRRQLAQVRMLWALWRSAGVYEREIARLRAKMRARSHDDLTHLSNADVIAWRDRATADVLPFAVLFQINNSGGFWDQKLAGLIDRAPPRRGRPHFDRAAGRLERRRHRRAWLPPDRPGAPRRDRPGGARLPGVDAARSPRLAGASRIFTLPPRVRSLPRRVRAPGRLRA